MLVIPNPDEQGLKKKVVKLINPSEEMARSNNSKCKTEPRFKPKIGSVFPAKRRLVKRMMFDYILHSLANIFCPPGSDTGNPSFSEPSQSKNNNNGCFKICTTPKSSNPKKSKIIYPASRPWLIVVILFLGLFFFLGKDKLAIFRPLLIMQWTYCTIDCWLSFLFLLYRFVSFYFYIIVYMVYTFFVFYGDRSICAARFHCRT